MFLVEEGWSGRMEKPSEYGRTCCWVFARASICKAKEILGSSSSFLFDELLFVTQSWQNVTSYKDEECMSVSCHIRCREPSAYFKNHFSS
jgi:hypothetical protein